MDEIAKAPPPGGGDGAIEMSFPGGIDNSNFKPPRPNKQENLSAPASAGTGGEP
jgi:hypothetical protein